MFAKNGQRPSSSQQTFSSLDRLKRSDEFGRVFAEKKSFSCGGFLWFVAKQSLPGRSRLGFAIQKNKVRRAVWRNKIRRWVIEFFRKHRCELPGYDFVFLINRATPSFQAVNGDEMKQWLSTLWELTKKHSLPREPNISFPQKPSA